MIEYSNLEDTFKKSISRARNLCHINTLLENQVKSLLDTKDMLRSSVVISISAFDYLVHEIFRIETIIRYKKGMNVSRILIPFSVAICQPEDIESAIDEHIRETNSYKSFVNSEKYAEALRCFIEDPWGKISDILNEDTKALKDRLDTIYKWRNRIVHEADINPVLGGIDLWPIEMNDVLTAVNDVEKIGVATISLFSNQYAESN